MIIIFFYIQLSLVMTRSIRTFIKIVEVQERAPHRPISEVI